MADYDYNFKNVVDDLFTFPQFKREPVKSEHADADRAQDQTGTIWTKNNAIGALKIISYVIFIPMAAATLINHARKWNQDVSSHESNATNDVAMHTLGTDKSPTVDASPTSAHAGVILAKVDGQEKLQFLREDPAKKGSWRPINSRNTPYSENQFEQVDLSKCIVERKGSITAAGKLVVTCTIRIGREEYQLPISSANAASLWEVHDKLTETLDKNLKTVCLAQRVYPNEESYSEKLFEPASKEFITNKDKSFNGTTDQNGIEITTILQAKGNLSAKEHCADWATVETHGNITLALVADAAGNKEHNHQGSVKLVNLFRENFWKQIDIRNSSIQDALGQAILLTKIETSADESDTATASTMACVVIVGDRYNENRYAVGFCVGDARVMLKRKEGESLDLTPTEFHSSYSNQGGNFSGKMDARPIFQKLEKGDKLLMGSDGFGDNMEAKSRGKTPLMALQELNIKGKLKGEEELQKLADQPEDWIEEATSTSYWTIESMRINTPESKKAREWQGKLTSIQKKQLQKIHTLYSELILDGMDHNNIADDVYNQCKETPLIEAGVFMAIVHKEIAEMHARFETKHGRIDESLIKQEELSILKKKLETYKEHARKLVPNMSDKEKDELFQEWDEDPFKARDWLNYRAGKPDDFSLIALTV